MFVMFRSRRETIQTGCGVIFLKDIVNNVMFVLIVLHTVRQSSLTKNHCTWYEAHFRNGLKITVYDEYLSQAQLAQLHKFLDFGVF